MLTSGAKGPDEQPEARVETGGHVSASAGASNNVAN